MLSLKQTLSLMATQQLLTDYLIVKMSNQQKVDFVILPLFVFKYLAMRNNPGSYHHSIIFR